MHVAQIMRNASSHNWAWGMESHCNVASSFTDNGSDINVEKRNIHFIKVMTEYLDITGLNAPR